MIDNKYSFEVTGDASDAVSVYEYSEDKGLSKTDSQKILEKQTKEKQEESVAPVMPDVKISGNDLEKKKGNDEILPVQTPVNNNI